LCVKYNKMGWIIWKSLTCWNDFFFCLFESVLLIDPIDCSFFFTHSSHVGAKKKKKKKKHRWTAIFFSGTKQKGQLDTRECLNKSFFLIIVHPPFLLERFTTLFYPEKTVETQLYMYIYNKKGGFLKTLNKHFVCIGWHDLISPLWQVTVMRGKTPFGKI
jgi:hypothetical protein